MRCRGSSSSSCSNSTKITEINNDCNDVTVTVVGTGVVGDIVGGDIIQTPALLRKAISAKPNNKPHMPWSMYPESILRRCGDQQQAEFRSEEEEEPEFRESASEALNF